MTGLLQQFHLCPSLIQRAIVTLCDAALATAYFIQQKSHGQNEVLFYQNFIKKHKNFSKNIFNVFSTVAHFQFPFNPLCDHFFVSHPTSLQPMLTNAISSTLSTFATVFHHPLCQHWHQQLASSISFKIKQFVTFKFLGSLNEPSSR